MAQAGRRSATSTSSSDEADQELAFQKAFTLELAFNGLFLVVLAVAIPLDRRWSTASRSSSRPGSCCSLAVVAVALQTPIWVYYRSMGFVRQRTLQAVDPIVGFVVTVGAGGRRARLLGAGDRGGRRRVGRGAVVAVRASPYPLRAALRPRHAALLRVVLVAAVPRPRRAALRHRAELRPARRRRRCSAWPASARSRWPATISDYTDRVDQIVAATLYPAICAVRDRRDLLFEAFVKSNRLALMWGMPFGVGLALFAADLVQFGHRRALGPAVGAAAGVRA